MTPSNQRFLHKKFTERKDQWTVVYGEKRMEKRQSCSFSDGKAAEKFFREKEDEGLYVDVFKDRITVETQRLTTKEGK